MNQEASYFHKLTHTVRVILDFSYLILILTVLLYNSFKMVGYWVGLTREGKLLRCAHTH